MSERLKQLRLGISVPRATIPAEMISERDQSFEPWALKARANGNLYKTSGLLLKHGIVSDLPEAIDVMEAVAIDAQSPLLALRSSDFLSKRTILNGTSRVLKELNAPDTENDVDLPDEVYSLNLGTISHKGIIDVLTRNFENQAWNTVRRIPKEQMYFDHQGLSIYRPLEEAEYTPDQGFSPDFIGELVYLSDLHSSLVQENPRLLHDRSYAAEFQRLEELLAPVYGRHLYEAKKLSAKAKNNERYIYTALTWARAVIDASVHPSKILFPEVQVIGFGKNGIDGGRMDAIEITSLDGYEPDSQDLELLNELSRMKYSSSGQLIATIRSQFGCNRVTARISDYKFSVGDAPRRGEMIRAVDVADAPIPRHVDQMVRYLTLSPIDVRTHLLEDEHELQPDNVWNVFDSFIDGEIIYYHPFSSPVTHSIILTPEQKKEHFNTYRDRLLQARSKASIRNADNAIGRYIEDNLDKSKKKKKQKKAIKELHPKIAQLLEM